MSTTDLEDFQNYRIDLHSHTKCSDGGLTPEELIDRATNFQIDVLAITDHDTVAAIDVALKHIETNDLKLKLVKGIEISTSWQNFEIHIVGLNIDHNNPSLRKLIASQQGAREERAKTMSEKLAKCGIENAYDKAQTLAGEGVITRAHFARVIQAEKQLSKLQAAFDKYIGKGKRAYAKPNWCSTAEAVNIIHLAGGTAVMAHPIRYDLSAKWLRRLIVDFKAVQGDGLEVVLPQMNNDQRRLMLNYCQEYELFASLGSDFHFPSRWTELGRNLVMPEQAKPIWQLWFDENKTNNSIPAV